MAKGNSVGQGQYRAPTGARAGASGLTGSSNKANDPNAGLMDSVKTLADSLGKNFTMGGSGSSGTTNTMGNTGNTGFSGMMGGSGYQSFGPSLMMGNPYNNYGGGYFNPYMMGMFNPNAPTGIKPPVAPPTGPPAPSAPTPGPSYDANWASNTLRQRLNRDLSGDEINQILGAMGKKATDTFNMSDIDRAMTLVNQYKPGYTGGSTPPPTQFDTGGTGYGIPTAPTPMGNYDSGGVSYGIPPPSSTPSAPSAPQGMSGQEALNALGLKGALSPQETQLLLSQFGGKTTFDQNDVARARGLVQQYRPDLL